MLNSLQEGECYIEMHGKCYKPSYLNLVVLATYNYVARVAPPILELLDPPLSIH